MSQQLLEYAWACVRVFLSTIWFHITEWMWQSLAPPSQYYPHSDYARVSSSRLWEVVELVEAILERLPRKDQVQMLFVSRGTWLIAAPLVWKDLPQLPQNLHVWSLLPPDLELGDWSEQIQRPLLVAPSQSVPLSTWGRFSLYAQYVQTLRLVMDRTGTRNTELLLHILRSHLAPPLFPRLRHLFIQVRHFPLHKDIMECLATPTLRELEINFCQDVNGYQAEDPTSFSHSAVHLMAVGRYPLLERFRCRARSALLGQLLALSDTLSTIISNQPRLVELELVNFDGILVGPLYAAGLLSNLSQISFFPPSSPLTASIPVATSMPLRPFPVLEILEAILPADYVPTLLSSISSPYLRQLEILFHFQGTDSLLPPAGSLLEVSRFTTLRTISLHFPDHAVKWADLQSLLSCSRLILVGLEGQGLSAIIGDKEIRSMARSWTGLRKLQVRDTSRYPSRLRQNPLGVAAQAPLTTLGGLGSLADHCPHLFDLEISVDACGMSEGWYGQNKHTIQNLHLPCSFMDDQVAEVAEFIVRMWPNIEVDDDHDDPYQRSKNDVTALMGKRWAKVWERVEELVMKESLEPHRIT